jgi:alanyl-tRNA synthetase
MTTPKSSGRKSPAFPKSRIFRLDEKDNFWQMGDTGPCGPCSEIHYDLGPEAAEKGREHEQFPTMAAERFVEIWNLVFMQFDRDADGKLTPLPRPPSIPAWVSSASPPSAGQAVELRHRSDPPIVDRAAELFATSKYGDDPRTDTALRINADHARATAFLIHDGVMPSNEGRGYVLRKIMRRAMRNAALIGKQDPYLYNSPASSPISCACYPEMMESIQRVARIVKDEEHRYATTFQVAEKVFTTKPKTREAAFCRRRRVQALRHLRPRARRAGRDGSRARPSRSISKASRPRWRSSGRARAPVGKAPTKPRSRRSIKRSSGHRIHRPRNAGIARRSAVA